MEFVPDHPVIQNMENTGYPDGKAPKVIHRCFVCGNEICEGEEFYQLWDKPRCEECVNDSRKVAESDDWN